MKPSLSILDIGSNKGTIAHNLQENAENITLVDVEDFTPQTGAKFLRGKWEDLNVQDKFELVLASYVWGHFYHDGIMNRAFDKALEATREGGHLVLCFNSDVGFVSKLVNKCKDLFLDFQYDVFNKSLLKGLNFEEIDFKVFVKAKDFEQLIDLIQVLIIVPDEIFEAKREEVKEYLKSQLSIPEFYIDQKLIIIRK